MKLSYTSIEDSTSGVPIVVRMTAVLATLGGAFVVFYLGVWLCASGFFHIRGGDAAVVLTVQRALLGTPILSDPSNIPYTITQYSPLIYMVDVALAKSFGVSADDPARISLICRSVSFAALLIMISVLILWLRRFARVTWPVALTGVAYCFIIFSPWGFAARPDSLQSMFTLSTILIAAAAADAPHRRSLLLFSIAALTSVASVYSKQNGIQAIAILFLFLLLQRRWHALAACTAAILGFILVFSWSAAEIVGSMWRQNLIGGIDNGIDLKNYIFKTYQDMAIFHAFPCAVAALMIHAGLKFLGALRDSEVALLLGLVCTFFCAALTAVKAGSAENYFNDFLVLQAIICIYSLWSKRLSLLEHFRARFVVAYLVSLYLIFFSPAKAFQQWSITFHHEPGDHRPLETHRFTQYSDVAAVLKDRIRQRPGYVASVVLPVCNLMPSACVVGDPVLSEVTFRRQPHNWKRYQHDVRTGKICYFVLNPGSPPASLFGVSMSSAKIILDSPKALVLEMPPPASAST